jgi:hypothetical protein
MKNRFAILMLQQGKNENPAVLKRLQNYDDFLT